MDKLDVFVQSLDGALAPFLFRKVIQTPVSPDFRVVAAWTLKTWNINRAVVVIEPFSAVEDLRKFVRIVKRQLTKPLGYFPLLYSLGFQIIVVGHQTSKWTPRPSQVVDKFDNQISVAQSIFIIDADTEEATGATTWGQFISGKFQDEIWRVLRDHFRVSVEGRN